MLKILHTADWHLGHRLHGLSRKYEHGEFLSWLLMQIEQTNADALIIAGDIFDSANPPANAQSVFYDFLVKARKYNDTLDIIVIGGNHDSASRLDAPSEILKQLGIQVVGGLTFLKQESVDWQRLLIPLKDKNGIIRAVCGAMPFIRNADLPQLNVDMDDDSNDSLIQGVSELYQQLFEQMQQYETELQLSNPLGKILTGHCYMVGTELSELSERRILGGNQHALPANIFNEKIDYVALGHLHKAQKVRGAQKETLIRYSGSPIPLSFSERNYKHQICEISLTSSSTTKTNKKAEACVNVKEIVIPRAVEIKCVPERGYIKLPELEAQLAASFTDKENFKSNVDENIKIQELYPLLEIKVELEKPEPDLRQQIEIMLENLAVRLLKISTYYPGKGEALADKKQQTRLEELHPEDVFQKCYQRNYDQKPPEKILGLFHQLLESVEGAE